jgi:hypothetical protein
MRGAPQAVGGVGASPGRAMLVPWPGPSTTSAPAAVTETLPRSTNTPKTPAFGPAKNRVPRTAINPKVLRILHRQRWGADRPVEEDWSRLEGDGATCINQKMVNSQARQFPDAKRRIGAKMHGEARRWSSADSVFDKQRR